MVERSHLGQPAAEVLEDVEAFGGAALRAPPEAARAADRRPAPGLIIDDGQVRRIPSSLVLPIQHAVAARSRPLRDGSEDPQPPAAHWEWRNARPGSGGPGWRAACRDSAEPAPPRKRRDRESKRRWPKYSDAGGDGRKCPCRTGHPSPAARPKPGNARAGARGMPSLRSAIRAKPRYPVTQ